MSTTTLFLTHVSAADEIGAACLLIKSLQTFGGEMSSCPIWVFTSEANLDASGALTSPQVRVIPLSAPDAVKNYPFGEKVLACALAEQLAPADVQSLTWIDVNCLVVQPPLLFDLDTDFDAALRPVHIRNVGLPLSEPLDAYWKGIYSAVGVDDIQTSVETFVDGQRLRSYFNSHGFAINPRLGLFQRWAEHFEQLVNDQTFQAAACADARHQIFLFQSLFSALIASSLPPARIRILPPTYNYPYNLHARVPQKRRAADFNELVCFTFEGRSIHPAKVTDIQIREPLRAWLSARALSFLTEIKAQGVA